MIVTLLALIFAVIVFWTIAGLATLILAMKIVYIAEEILEEEERHD